MLGVGIVKDLLASEGLLPLGIVLDLCTQTGGLTLMVEVGAKDSGLVGIYGEEAADATPQTHTFHGEDIFSLSIDVADVVGEALVVLLLFLYHLRIAGLGSLTVKTALVERVEDLLFWSRATLASC